MKYWKIKSPAVDEQLSAVEQQFQHSPTNTFCSGNLLLNLTCYDDSDFDTCKLQKYLLSKIEQQLPAFSTITKYCNT